MRTEELQQKHGLSLAEVSHMRERFSGRFGVRVQRRTRDWDHAVASLGIREANRVAREIVSDWEFAGNIVTNEGLDHILDTELSGGTAITAWRVGVIKTNTTPLATHTYAVPGATEIAASDVTETVRQAFTDGGVSGQSVDNSASPATYTADATWTAYGAQLLGGGTAPQTIANTAGGGTLYAMALFGSSKSMTASDTIDITYTFTAADDGA